MLQVEAQCNSYQEWCQHTNQRVFCFSYSMYKCRAAAEPQLMGSVGPLPPPQGRASGLEGPGPSLWEGVEC